MPTRRPPVGDKPSYDFRSIRIGVTFSEGSPGAAVKFADQAAAELLALAKTKEAAGGQLERSLSGDRPGEFYRWSKARRRRWNPGALVGNPRFYTQRAAVTVVGRCE